MNKRIDSLGRIVIPKDYRKKLNINDGELFDVLESSYGVYNTLNFIIR